MEIEGEAKPLKTGLLEFKKESWRQSDKVDSLAAEEGL